jgi:hypothetical protein
MVRVVGREIRKRGFFGWVFLLIFFGFNGAMAVWLFWYWRLISSEAEGARAGGAFFGIIGSGILLFLWAAGALITGVVAQWPGEERKHMAKRPVKDLRKHLPTSGRQ